MDRYSLSRRNSQKSQKFGAPAWVLFLVTSCAAVPEAHFCDFCEFLCDHYNFFYFCGTLKYHFATELQ